jgi:hypothetical protein
MTPFLILFAFVAVFNNHGALGALLIVLACFSSLRRRKS